MNIDWNAQEYLQDFSFVPRYGEDVLNLLDVHTGDRVIDLGCGNGMLTKRLSEMGLNVTGIDASEEMLGIARSSYPELTFIKSDALDFTVDEPVDAVFSNAVFHWIDRDKQPLLLRQINRALKPGGELVCEFGGKGCASKVHEALRQSFRKRGLEYAFSFYFPTIGEYATLLEQAGFKVVYAWLFDRPTACKNGECGLRDWIRMFDKQPFRMMDANTENEILSEAEQALSNDLFNQGSWHIDYVRIRLKAIKE
ncbi:MAG: methyltransferase domain-containing protein [Bacteroidales bacterium]|nr:methyltransferase domain-containing protein [Bacteroidales bacterium]